MEGVLLLRISGGYLQEVLRYLVKSSDGSTWSDISYGSGKSQNKIIFCENKLFAVGAGVIYSDNGSNWESVNVGGYPNYSLEDVVCVSN